MTHIDEILAALVEARRSGFQHTAAVLEDWLDREIAERDGVSQATAKRRHEVSTMQEALKA